MTQTSEQYLNVIQTCKEIFIKKTNDYGTAWRILRSSSLTDQIFIKAQRIRTIQETGENKVGESIVDEFKAIVNYCIMALIQLEKKELNSMDLSLQQAVSLFEEYSTKSFDLMLKKNHDYGEAWRDMSQESYADLILVKLLRIRQILTNDGKTLISEGIDANFVDILNYATFALIQISEGKH